MLAAIRPTFCLFGDAINFFPRSVATPSTASRFNHSGAKYIVGKWEMLPEFCKACVRCMPRGNHSVSIIARLMRMLQKRLRLQLCTGCYFMLICDERECVPRRCKSTTKASCFVSCVCLTCDYRLRRDPPDALSIASTFADLAGQQHFSSIAW
jgi:hypothetical protein